MSSDESSNEGEEIRVGVSSPPGDCLVESKEERKEAAVKALIDKGVERLEAGGLVEAARVAEADAARLYALVQSLDTTAVPSARLAGAIGALALDKWEEVARVAEWSQHLVTAFFKQRKAREEEGRALTRKPRPPVVAKEAPPVDEAACEAARKARADAEARGEDPFADTLEVKASPALDYDQFLTLNDGGSKTLGREAYVAHRIRTIEEFRTFCMANYEDIRTMPSMTSRNSEVARLWRARRERKLQWCLERGRVVSYADFVRACKAMDLKRRPCDAWADYNEAWDSIVGMRLSKRRNPDAKPRKSSKKAVRDEASSDDESSSDEETERRASKKKKASPKRSSSSDEEVKKSKKSKKRAPSDSEEDSEEEERKAARRKKKRAQAKLARDETSSSSDDEDSRRKKKEHKKKRVA